MQRKERKSVTERIKSHTFQRFCFYYNEFLLESTQSHDYINVTSLNNTSIAFQKSGYIIILFMIKAT